MQLFSLSVVAFIFVLGILVFVHEFGHYAVAKLFKVRVEVFSLGFGKRLLRVFPRRHRWIREHDHETRPCKIRKAVYAFRIAALNGDLAATLRLNLLPPLAMAAAVAYKLTGSDKGVW